MAMLQFLLTPMAMLQCLFPLLQCLLPLLQCLIPLLHCLLPLLQCMCIFKLHAYMLFCLLVLTPRPFVEMIFCIHLCNCCIVICLATVTFLCIFLSVYTFAFGDLSLYTIDFQCTSYVYVVLFVVTFITVA